MCLVPRFKCNTQHEEGNYSTVWEQQLQKPDQLYILVWILEHRRETSSVCVIWLKLALVHANMWEM